MEMRAWGSTAEGAGISRCSQGEGQMGRGHGGLDQRLVPSRSSGLAVLTGLRAVRMVGVEEVEGWKRTRTSLRLLPHPAPSPARYATAMDVELTEIPPRTEHVPPEPTPAAGTVPAPQDTTGEPHDPSRPLELTPHV